MTTIRPRRSVLYMPGSNARALEKARALPADALILDLEDAVAPDAKDVARVQVCEAVKARGFGKREIVVRINALSTPWGVEDLAAAAQAQPDAILVPKISSSADLDIVEARLVVHHHLRKLAIWAMVETPAAILNIASIAGAGGRLAAFVMGTNDLIKEIRGVHTEDRSNLSAALGLSVLAARANGLAVIDGVYNDIADADGFEASCEQARAFGFDGKTLIHPSQIEPCNAVFAPSAEEVAAARKVLAAFELPENKGKGAIKLDGRMVELLHAEIARGTVAMADAIDALQRGASVKTNPGNFFEEFHIGQKIAHATPRTLSHGDAALYQALYGSRFALQSSDVFAQEVGLPKSPLDDLLVFHTVFGKSVPDISLNAVANLGYAEGRFLRPVYPGETLSAHSEVIGLKENSNRQTGIVYVRTTGMNEKSEGVLTFVRWVMVRKRDPEALVKPAAVPKLAEAVAVEDLRIPAHLNFDTLFETDQSGSRHLWDDYAVGEKIDHVDGITVEEAEHMMATRLYQNTARVHFNQYAEGQGRFGRRLIYGGHVISLARAISFNGLANAFSIAGINGGRHVNPLFAGDTVFAWSKVLDKQMLGHRKDVGLLRLRLVATKNLPCADFPDRGDDGAYPDGVVLDFDYWAVMPRG